MEKGKGKEMKETVVQDRKSYACMSIPDLSVGDNMTPAEERTWQERSKTQDRPL